MTIPTSGKTDRIVKLGEVPVLSANGRYVAFIYFFEDLVPGTTPGSDVYLLDLQTQRLQLISVSPQGQEGDRPTTSLDSLSISADGRYVAFASDATNLVPDERNGEQDVFVRDTLTGTTILVSVDSNETPLAANTLDFNMRPAIAANGKFVVFQSKANNLVANDTNQSSDVFVRDLVAGITTRVSISSSGEQSKTGTFVPSDARNASISGDGRYVAFESNAINFDSRDAGTRNFDVFVHDRQTGQTRQVSVNSQGAVAAGESAQETSIGFSNTDWSSNPVISANGRYVVFQSGATNLITNDTNNRVDVFRHDLQTGETILISTGLNGTPANGGSSLGFSRNSAISGDGRYVVFQSFANNLVADDNNNASDVFLRDVVTGATERISVNSGGQEAVGGQPTGSGNASVSDDGRYVVFLSRSANLVDDPLAPFNFSVYLRDRFPASTSTPPVNPGTKPVKTQIGNNRRNRLVGSKRDDLLSGLGGNDRLVGEGGNDQLLGGTGRDQFIYNRLSDRQDQILDFTPKRDKIVLRPLLQSTVREYEPGNAIREKYVRFQQIGSDVRIDIDRNGRRAGGITPLLVVNDITLSSLRQTQNFEF